MSFFHRVASYVTNAVTDSWKRITLLFPQPPILEGKVISKWHEPERTWIQLVGYHVGSATRSVGGQYLPFYRRDDEDWVLRLEVVYPRPSGRVFYRRRNVYLGDKARFDQAVIGQSYRLLSDDSEKDPLESHLATREEQDTITWVEPRE